jgi:polar amino acid transport system ATP-binding protein
MEGRNSVITVTQVHKRFGSRAVLDGVDVEFRAGETVAILGPSGGGKSTLLRCLNGLNTFDAGEIRVGEHVLRPGPTHRQDAVHKIRRVFGMVFQDFQLFPHLTVLGNVIEAPVRVARLSHAEAVKRATDILHRVGMAGQKQRVAIARALAMEPRGLLCDEITSSLDPELKYEVLRVLEDLKRDGLTLLLVTHEIGFARKVADRVVVLCDGKILEDGSPAVVLDGPRTERMKLFLQRVMG